MRENSWKRESFPAYKRAGSRVSEIGKMGRPNNRDSREEKLNCELTVFIFIVINRDRNND
jgi:hypothetical protein